MRNEFRDWIKTPDGEAFLSIELANLSSMYPLMVGSHGLQVCLSESHDYLKAANLSERFFIIPPDANSIEQPCIKAATHELPFAKNEFSVIAAPHLIETSVDPQAALREIYRVTALEGLVLLTGINPLSLFGLRTKIMFSKTSRAQGFISISRLKDWLRLLGFDIVAGNMFLYSGLLYKSCDQTISGERKTDLMRRLHNTFEAIGDRWFPMTSGAYVLVARKRALGTTFVGKTSGANRRSRGLVGVKPVVTRVNTESLNIQSTILEH